jgi:hypothetical protein
MNAKMAREILKDDCYDRFDWATHRNADGYLSALAGPEVKALAEVSERLIANLNCHCFTGKDEKHSDYCLIGQAYKALSQFHALTKEAKP